MSDIQNEDDNKKGDEKERLFPAYSPYIQPLMLWQDTCHQDQSFLERVDLNQRVVPLEKEPAPAALCRRTQTDLPLLPPHHGWYPATPVQAAMKQTCDASMCSFLCVFF